MSDHILDISKMVALLRDYNLWRRDDRSIYEMPNTRELGIAIDTVCDAVDKMLTALDRLHDTAGQRMMADDPTGDERMAFLNAWKAAGELLQEVRGE